jgi:hypothetical protein
MPLVLASAACGSDEREKESSATGGSAGTGGTAGASGSGGTSGGAGNAQGGSGGEAGSAGDAGASGQAGDAGTGGQTGSGTTALYEPCQETVECLPGLHCQSNVPEPQGGQCSHVCNTNDDCEAAAVGNPVLCHPVSNTCVMGCGVNGGTCPPGLVCTDVQFCTETSGLTPTKNTGESCTTALECLNDAACVSGEHTAPYCSPPCTKDEDCKVGAPDAVGTCNAAGGLTFCIYMCGFMANGAACPGDMTCEVAVCR